MCRWWWIMVFVLGPQGPLIEPSIFVHTYFLRQFFLVHDLFLLFLLCFSFPPQNIYFPHFFLKKMIGSSHPVVHVWLQAQADTALFKKNEYFFSEYSGLKKSIFFEWILWIWKKWNMELNHLLAKFNEKNRYSKHIGQCRSSLREACPMDKPLEVF